jgi:hypothetical protein
MPVTSRRSIAPMTLPDLDLDVASASSRLMDKPPRPLCGPSRPPVHERSSCQAPDFFGSACGCVWFCEWFVLCVGRIRSHPVAPVLACQSQKCPQCGVIPRPS